MWVLDEEDGAVLLSKAAPRREPTPPGRVKRSPEAHPHPQLPKPAAASQGQDAWAPVRQVESYGWGLSARPGPPPPPAQKLCNSGPVTESLGALVSPADKRSKMTAAASKGNREITLPGTHQILDYWLHLQVN